MKEHVSIRRKGESEDVYKHLLEQSIREVQRLSGEIWTDYNEHDPGVTLLEALNYTLLELDYRLLFDPEDYLSSVRTPFDPVQNALFFPEDVFTVNPVTATDYRKLFLSSIEGLVNVWTVTHCEEGTYDFILDVSRETSDDRRRKIIQEVTELYHTHRNLCENLGTIHILEHKSLQLKAVIDIDGQEDANLLTACLYVEIQEFLSAGVRFNRIDEMLEKGYTTDELLDGPRQHKPVVDEHSLQSRKSGYNFLHLYHKLRRLPGIVNIISVSLQYNGMDFEEYLAANPLEESAVSFGIDLSPAGNQQDIVLRKKGKEVPIDWELIFRMYSLMRLKRYGNQNLTADKEALYRFPQGVYRELFTHYPVKNDLPACYTKADQLHTYLEMFDHLITDTLSELKNIPFLLRADSEKISDTKEQWFDMLDRIYGEDSNPSFLKAMNSTQENRIRRAHFLSRIPEWGYGRGKGCNLLDYSLASISGIEEYMKAIMDFDKHELEMFVLEHTLFGASGSNPEPLFIVSIVFSAHNDCMDDDGFRSNCELLLSSRVPAHIGTNIYWLNKNSIRAFKPDYTFWRYLLSTPKKKGVSELSEKILTYLNNGTY